MVLPLFLRNLESVLMEDSCEILFVPYFVKSYTMKRPFSEYSAGRTIAAVDEELPDLYWNVTLILKYKSDIEQYARRSWVYWTAHWFENLKKTLIVLNLHRYIVINVILLITLLLDLTLKLT